MKKGLKKDKKDICKICSKTTDKINELKVNSYSIEICDICLEKSVSFQHKPINKRNLADIPTTQEIFDYLSRFVIGQDKVKRKLATAVVYHYLRANNEILGKRKSKSNILLIGLQVLVKR